MAGLAWRTGVNMREFAYYGSNVLNDHTQAGLQDQQLAALRDLQVKVVRFYASHREFATDACIQKVDTALGRLKAFGMQAIVCLDDSLTSAFTVHGNNPFHTQVQGHYDKHYYLDQHYRDFYIPHVQQLVGAFKNHSAVLVWELGNEFAIHPRPSEMADSKAFLKFLQVASQTVKNASPNKLVSTGFLNSRQVASDDEIATESKLLAFAKKVYKIETIDLMSCHFYEDNSEEHFAPIDVQAAAAFNKAFYVGELGSPVRISGGGQRNRSDYYRNKIQQWKANGAFTVLPWAFDTSPFDVGISDNEAFAGIYGDFNDLKGIVRNFA